jgi:hypothetical protein
VAKQSKLHANNVINAADRFTAKNNVVPFARKAAKIAA